MQPIRDNSHIICIQDVLEYCGYQVVKYEGSLFIVDIGKELVYITNSGEILCRRKKIDQD